MLHFQGLRLPFYFLAAIKIRPSKKVNPTRLPVKPIKKLYWFGVRFNEALVAFTSSAKRERGIKNKKYFNMTDTLKRGEKPLDLTNKTFGAFSNHKDQTNRKNTCKNVVKETVISR